MGILIEKATAIETTYLRAGTLPQSYGEQAQQPLRQYVDVRLDFDNVRLDPDRLTENSNRSKRRQEQQWEDLNEISKVDRTARLARYIKSLNETHCRSGVPHTGTQTAPDNLCLSHCGFSVEMDTRRTLLVGARYRPSHHRNCYFPYRRSRHSERWLNPTGSASDAAAEGRHQPSTMRRRFGSQPSGAHIRSRTTYIWKPVLDRASPGFERIPIGVHQNSHVEIRKSWL